MLNIAKGTYNDVELTAFITVYLMRSITIDELQGFRDGLLELAVPVNLNGYKVMDIVGTGGDGKNTFNISTLSCFIVAGAGKKVAKHGNYGATSVSGASNVMEQLGYQFSSDSAKLHKEIAAANICFMHAPLFHPAMKNVAPIRKELGVKTFFNMLGPMVNPAFPKRQLVGVFSLELARQYGYLYQNTDKEFLILHSLDGYDEVSLTGSFKYFYNDGERIMDPADIGQQKLKYADIRGGESVEESAKIFMNVLENKGTPAQKAAIIANAGMAIFAGNQKAGLSAAMERAKESLESGKALEKFKALIVNS